MISKEKMELAISQLAADQDIIDLVKHVEAGIKTTKGNYGRYMPIISEYARKSKIFAYVLAEALKMAGADEYGVSWAYKLATGCESDVFIAV